MNQTEWLDKYQAELIKLGMEPLFAGRVRTTLATGGANCTLAEAIAEFPNPTECAFEDYNFFNPNDDYLKEI